MDRIITGKLRKKRKVGELIIKVSKISVSTLHAWMHILVSDIQLHDGIVYLQFVKESAGTESLLNELNTYLPTNTESGKYDDVQVAQFLDSKVQLKH